MATDGTVYVMASPSMPGIVKIGFTRGHISDRCRQLNQDTGSPGDWAPLTFWDVSDCRAAEKYLHGQFKAERIFPHKEFFRVTVERVTVAFDGSRWTSEPCEPNRVQKLRSSMEREGLNGKRKKKAKKRRNWPVVN